MNDRTVEDDLALLREEGPLLRDVAAVDLALPVPSCPGWTQADLLGHVGRSYRWAARNVASDDGGEVPREKVGGIDDDSPVLEWFDHSLGELLEVLEDVDPGTEVWTYGSDGTVRFWIRRMAHESMMHRWDAQHARGDTERFDPGVAVDAIDELLDVRVMTPGLLAEAGSVLHVRAEDANADWSLDPEFPDELGRGFAEGDAHLHGPSAELLLSLWRRIDTDSVRWEGDREAVRAWSETLAELDLSG